MSERNALLVLIAAALAMFALVSVDVVRTRAA